MSVYMAFFVLPIGAAAILVAGIRFSHWWYEQEKKTEEDRPQHDH